MSYFDYGENTPTIMYGPHEGEYHVYFRVCPNCGRYVKADETCRIPEYQGKEPNATCKKCGRVQMPFCTWVPEDEDEMNDREWDYMAHCDIRQ